jgi:predicted RNA binding protein YcfA (HicA-like mRNA interferase family)
MVFGQRSRKPSPFKLGSAVLISVPVHGNKPLKKGALKALLQNAELLDTV